MPLTTLTIFCNKSCKETIQLPNKIVCVEVLWPNQPNGVILSVVSLPNHTFTEQAYSSRRLTGIVHILSPETVNCPSWISRRESMTVENISWSILHERMLTTPQGSNPQPPDHQSDPTKPQPAKIAFTTRAVTKHDHNPTAPIVTAPLLLNNMYNMKGQITI